VGLVGESGSGKSMTARAIDRLLPRGAEVQGPIRFGGTDVNELAGSDLRWYRNQVAMIFQDPRAHTNPVRRVGDFMTEALRTNLGVRAAEARRRAVAMLTQVGIEDGAQRLRSPGTIAPGAGLGAIPPMGVNRPSPLQQPQLPGSRYGLSPGGGAQLAVDRLDVRLDGQGRQEQLGGDLGVLQMGG